MDKTKGVLIIVDMDSILATKVIFAFFLSIAIIYAIALAIGHDNKKKWFKKRQQIRFFTRRGMLGETCHFGYPCTWQGLLVSIIMYFIIGLVSYEFIFNL